MRTYSTPNRNRDLAGVARAQYACVMPAASWSFPTIPVVTGHKHRPRRHRVIPL